MATNSPKSEARINFRLPADLKQQIEQAAAHLGQSVSEFAASNLAQAAQETIREQSVTQLTNRDRDLFFALLDDVEAQPNDALKAAAQNYTQQME